MLTHLRPAVALLAAMILLTGLAYPIAMTGLAGVIAPEKARGSLIERDGATVGSALIGQGFSNPAYLHPRASASGWNAAGTGATNLGPTSAALVAQVAERRASYEGGAAPADALTTSGSGLDPDISPENARAQAPRIAAARGVPVADILRLIAGHTEGRWLGLYGAPRVNVLRVNLALDDGFGQPARN